MNGNGEQEGSAEALTTRIGRRLERRYRRLCFVQRELARLDAAEKPEAPGSFEDFVFGQIDFSIYKKIDEEEFCLFDEGLEDYDEGFFVKAFGMNRKDTGGIIGGAYVKVGNFRVCKKADPLLLSIMRSLHTSLEFVPLFLKEELENEEQYRALIAALDGVEVRHSDGMTTRLFVPKNERALCGTFHPLGKAHTITLLAAGTEH
jgi:hypothetical protein